MNNECGLVSLPFPYRRPFNPGNRPDYPDYGPMDPVSPDKDPGDEPEVMDFFISFYQGIFREVAE